MYNVRAYVYEYIRVKFDLFFIKFILVIKYPTKHVYPEYND